MAERDERLNEPKLLILNQMAGPMTWELAVDLAKHLDSVAVLTGHPDTLAKGSQQGVTLYPSATYQRGNFAVRFFSWLRYFAHVLFWLWKWPATTPILVFSNPPIGPWAVRLIHMLRGTPYSVMVHDIYPEVVIRMGVASEKNWLIRFWKSLNRWAYDKARLVMTLGENMADVLTSQFAAERTAAGKLEVIYPWADTEALQPIPKSENDFARQHDQQNFVTVMYSGNMGLGHDIETMLSAAERLVEHENLKFMFIGAGPKWQLVDETLQSKHLPNVTLLPWQDESLISRSLATADVAMVSLEVELSALAIPSKTFYFWAAGVPVLVLSEPDTELANLVKAHDCGWSLAVGDVDGMVNVLSRLASNPEEVAEAKLRSRQAAETFGSRSANAQKIYDLLHEHLLG